MSTASSIAADLAVVVFLYRDRPEARGEQATALQALRASLAGGGLHVAVEPEGLTVGGVLVTAGTPGAGALREQLLLHGVGELNVGAGVDDGTLGALLRALAAPGDSYRSLHELLESVHAVASTDITLAPPVRPAAVQPPEGFQWVAADALMGGVTPLPGARPGAGETSAGETSTEETRAGPRPETDAAGSATVDELLARLDADPADPALPQLLGSIVTAADQAAAAERWDEVVRIAQTIVRAEAAVGGGASGRDYPVALRRIFSRSVLLAVARLAAAADVQQRAAAVTVLRRFGADATDVLLGYLAEAPTLEERRGYYDALKTMTEGGRLFAGMLTRDEWYVVRNVADLCGDLRLEEAVPALARQVTHTDERVRRAVAGALAKIGTPATVEPLRQALRDPAPAVRLQAARGVEGWHGRGLAMTLSLVLDDETDSEVQHELLFALARIGTPEAVQAIVRTASPGGRIFNRKPVTLRLFAVEALGAAATAQAATALQALLADSDTEVRDAARKALAAITR